MSSSKQRGSIVVDRPGRWSWQVSRIRGAARVDLLGTGDSESEAVALIEKHFESITDRDASLLVEQAALQGTVLAGNLCLVLAKVA